MFIDIDKKFDGITYINSGTYGIVYKVTDKVTKQTYAMKISYIDKNYIINPIILREIINLKRNKSKHIINLIDVNFGLFYKRKCIYLLLELCNKTLFEVLQENKYDSKLLIQLIESVNSLHNSGYYHGDLSFTNIMVNDKNEIKLIDFGNCKKSYRKYDINFRPSLMVQHIKMMENKDENEISGVEVDNWSLGCIYYKFKTGQYLIDPIDQNYKKKFITKYNGIDTNDNLTPDDKETLYNLFNNNHIFNVSGVFNFNDFNIKSKRDNIFNKLTEIDRFNIILFLSNFIRNNKMEDELLYSTISNAKKVRFESYKNISELILCIMITFWITNQILSHKILSKNDMISLLKSININIVDFDNFYYKILKQLKWDADANTLYSYIDHIPEKLKNKYEHIILYLEISNYYYDNIFNTLNGIIDLFKEKHNNIDYNGIDIFLSNMKNHNNAENIQNEQYRIKTHIKNSIIKKIEIEKFIYHFFSVNNTSHIYEELSEFIN